MLTERMYNILETLLIFTSLVISRGEGKCLVQDRCGRKRINMRGREGGRNREIVFYVSRDPFTKVIPLSSALNWLQSYIKVTYFKRW